MNDVFLSSWDQKNWPSEKYYLTISITAMLFTGIFTFYAFWRLFTSFFKVRAQKIMSLHCNTHFRNHFWQPKKTFFREDMGFDWKHWKSCPLLPLFQNEERHFHHSRNYNKYYKRFGGSIISIAKSIRKIYIDVLGLNGYPVYTVLLLQLMFLCNLPLKTSEKCPLMNEFMYKKNIYSSCWTIKTILST